MGALFAAFALALTLLPGILGSTEEPSADRVSLASAAGVTAQPSVAPHLALNPAVRFRAAISREVQAPVTIAFGGDTLMHPGVARAAKRNGDPFDFGPIFEDVRHVISNADLAICHLEGPLDPQSTGLSGYPFFNGPRELADGLVHAGFDGCSTASNHSIDQGVQGILDTIEVLEEAGLEYAGTAKGPGDDFMPVLFEVGDLTIGHVSATYWLNGLREPSDKQWLVDIIDIGEIVEDALRARRDGADLVVVSLHCCTEYTTMPTAWQMELSHKLIGSPVIDLIVTHHSHWVGPVEEVEGEFILHGLGNLLSGQTHTARTADGVVALVEAEQANGKWRFTSVEAVPTRVERGSYRIRRTVPGDGSYERTMTALAAMGVDVSPFSQSGLTLVQRSLLE